MVMVSLVIFHRWSGYSVSLNLIYPRLYRGIYWWFTALSPCKASSPECRTNSASVRYWFLGKARTVPIEIWDSSSSHWHAQNDPCICNLGILSRLSVQTAQGSGEATDCSGNWRPSPRDWHFEGGEVEPVSQNSELQASLKSYEENAASTGSTNKTLKEQLDNSRLILGMVDVKGPGITMTPHRGKYRSKPYRNRISHGMLNWSTFSMS